MVRKTTTTFLIFGFAFLYTPIVFLVISSLSGSPIPGVWTHFSLQWFYAVFKNEDLINAVITSLEVASISATGAVILGLLAAVSTASSNTFFSKRLLSGIMIIPIIMPEIIIGFSLLMFFVAFENAFGLPKIRGVMTITIGHIMAAVTYVHVTIRSQLLELDTTIEEAALDLGARPFTIFLRIKIPLIYGSIFTSWLLAFAISLDETVIASFLNGPGVTTIPILFLSSLKRGISPEINAFSTMFILMVMFLVLTHFALSTKPKKKRR